MSLVQKEMEIDEKDTEKLLNGSPDVLEKKGVAILNLKITGRYLLWFKIQLNIKNTY